MEKNIKEKIIKRLHEIEDEHNVKVLYALESGSRAWGFESKDSDYDVRFIYKRTESSYLEVFEHRDVIEYPIVDEFDYAGWDLKKALFLLHKSNPVLFEWFRSPIIYIKNESFFKRFMEFSENYFSKVSSTYHYIQMAKGNYREYLKKDFVKIKKYFYVLRPVLACMWIEKYGQSPPVEFESMLVLIEKEKELCDQIMVLLEKKRSGNEMGLEKKVENINEFIEEKLNYFESVVSEYDKIKKPDKELVNLKFRELLKL